MKALNQIKKEIQKAKSIVISGHLNPDGDSIGSMLALGLGLKALKKNVTVLCCDRFPGRYKSLPGARDVVKRAERRFDLAISVDVSFEHMLGKAAGIFSRAKIIAEIDHHEIRQSFGDISFSDPKASCIGEIIYGLLKSLKVQITKEIAENILTSLIVETNSFRLPNVSGRAFALAALMMSYGVDYSRLTENVYWHQSRKTILVSAVCLSRCRFLKRGKVVWSIIRRNDLKKYGAKNDDIDAVPDDMRAIKGVKVAVFFREQNKNTLRVSLRSKDSINVAQIASRFGGGGHTDVAGCFIPNTKKDIQKLLSCIKI